jgi:hypothetical protein
LLRDANGNLLRKRTASDHKHKEYEVKAFHPVEFGIVCLQSFSRSHGKNPCRRKASGHIEKVGVVQTGVTLGIRRPFVSAASALFV